MQWSSFKISILNIFFDLLCLGFSVLFILSVILGSHDSVNAMLASVLMSVLLLFTFIATHSIGSKFDKFFAAAMTKQADNIIFLGQNGSFWVQIKMARTSAYVRNILFPKSSKKSKMQYRWFQDYNLREHASLFDKVLSYLLLVTFVLLLISIFITF